jgi:hypothetical protein
MLGLVLFLLAVSGVAVTLYRRSRVNRRPLFPPSARPRPATPSYEGPRQITSESETSDEGEGGGPQPSPPPPPQPETPKARDIYARAFAAACASAVIYDAEWVELDALARSLDLSAADCHAIERPYREALLERAAQTIIASCECAPPTLDAFWAWLGQMRYQEDELHATEAEELIDELSYLSHAWKLANEALPLKEVPIALQRGELCHAQGEVTWMEQRARSVVSLSYGPVMRVPLAAGLSFRVAAHKHTRIEHNALEIIDHGALYVTNKRLIFTGSKKNTAIRLSGILNITPHENGIVIDKAAGKSPHLELYGADPLLMATIMRRLVSEYNA